MKFWELLFMQDILFFFSEHTILISIWLLLFIGVLFFITTSIFFKDKIINNITAIKLINQDKAIVIDTRSSELFKEGHIINSINIPLKNIFLGDFEEIEKYKLFPIILIIQDTYRDKKCIKNLLKSGFKRVYLLKNGIYYWNLDHLPLITTKNKIIK